MSEQPGRWDGVFWDIGGVIVDLESVKHAQRSFLESLLWELSLEQNEDSALRTWRQAVGDYFREREEYEFRPADEAYHRGVRAVAGKPVDRSVWRPLFDTAFVESIRPEPGVVSTLRTLATRDVHLGIISDIDNREAETILLEFEIKTLFDSVTTSEDVGRTKPTVEIFEAALDESPTMAERSVMVGDRYGHDMVGGTDAGLWTVGYGTEDGPAVDVRIDNLADIVLLVDGDCGVSSRAKNRL